MSKTFVVCSILAPEVEHIIKEAGLTNKLRYIPGALHVDLNKIKNAVVENVDAVKENGEEPALIIGTRCHPEMEIIANERGCPISKGGNCIELLLGEEKMKELDAECNTFYLTAGWLAQWREIFCTGGHMWDPIDAKMNFGMYERILLIDTGFAEYSDEDIFEFFDYTGVPIETISVSVDNLKQRILELISA